MFDFSKCLKQGLLRKIPRSKQKSESSIKTAEKWIDESKKNLDSESYNSCLISSYLVMFHSARAILFSDGYREKSHACISRYLDEKYVKTGLLDREFVDLLDHHRELRHQDQYGFQFAITNDECNDAVKTAERFLLEMKRVLLGASK